MGSLFQINQPDHFVFIQCEGDRVILMAIFRQKESYCGEKQIRRHFGGLGM